MICNICIFSALLYFLSYLVHLATGFGGNQLKCVNLLQFAFSKGCNLSHNMFSKHHTTIASQLIDFPYGDGLEIAFGGGRKNFLRVGDHDDYNKTKRGLREDGRNLKEEWLKTKDHKYIHDKRGLDNLTPNVKNKVLGECLRFCCLFSTDIILLIKKTRYGYQIHKIVQSIQ